MLICQGMEKGPVGPLKDDMMLFHHSSKIDFAISFATYVAVSPFSSINEL